jgi:membrane-bound metal-dependent hydrolase YbcI (DUF457 family)
MMGRSHSLSGAVAGLAAAPLVGTLTHRPLGPGGLALMAAVTAGAALLPDLDHEDGTLSHALGPVSDLATKAVAWASGGHRHATHSLAFALAAGLGTWALVGYASRWAMLALVLALIAAGLRALDVNATAGWPRCWLAAAVITGAAGRWYGGPWSWLPYAVGLGCLAHLAGDLLTPEGCPLLWPRRGRWDVPGIDITTDTWRETRVIAPGLALAVVVLVARAWIQL